MLKYSCRRFGIVHSFLGLADTSNPGYIIGTHPPSRGIPEHTPLVRNDSPTNLHLTTLPNGVRIISETGGFPSSVYLGVTISAGTRDETEKNSGVVHALEKTALKTNVRTNEQINYGMIQMSGGAFSMTYNQEYINYQSHCLAHDTYDILQMLSDVVLDEKTVMDEEAAQWRIDEYWKLRNVTLTTPKRLDELWLSTAYGLTGFGMPLSGFESNFQNIGYYYMNQFRKNYITADRILVWGAGIQSHQEFVDAVTPYYQHLDATKAKPRTPSKYIGGDARELVDSPVTHVSLSFHGLSRLHPDVNALYVLKYIIGKSNTGLFNRAFTHFHQKYAGLVYIDPHHTTFEDTGNFRINFAATNEKIGEVSHGIVKEIQDFANITEEEFKRAKTYLAQEAVKKFYHPGNRVNKSVNVLSHTQKLNSTAEFIKEVEDVTLARVKEAAAKVFKTYPTVVVIGGNTHAVPTAESFHSKLR